MSVKDYTLIIPTHNRPAQFGALLKYLESQQAEFDILVLDSSSPETQALNAEVISQVRLPIRLLSFPAEMPPFEKFWKGIQQVKTDFCSLCADDDVLIIESLGDILNFLKRNKSYAAAHGLYFSFDLKKEIIVSDLVYLGDILTRANPIIRLQKLFQNYEAITYAVYRTPIIENIFSQLQSLDSLLGQELLGGALTVAAGRVKRLPLLYYGRSLSPSHFYQNWHPVEMLLTSPDAFYNEYSKYRKILATALKASLTSHKEAELYKLIDIIHFSYVNEFFAPNVASYLGRQLMRHMSVPKIMTGLWPLIIQNQPNRLQKLGPKLRPFFYKLIYNSQTLESPFYREFNGQSFHFLDSFKKKSHLYKNRGASIHDLLVKSMSHYPNALSSSS